ncbi:TPA: hypothetical protein N0F65_008170 [Lagenidium giganteum]|uniref:Uncharacterized protein n=1 Tax=Lagenidium giganteum TaxID=4803 RepID=A0AAV2YND9_9STRA|nr:TPA: hypothetical protein N0F65_008170 [Lagenidium giganteum]
MGQVCSGSAVSKHVHAPRDPEDKELDEIEMKETKIEDFDSFFERAAAPVNQLVELHNSIAQSEDNLKSAAAAIQGEAQVRVLVSGSGRVDTQMWAFDEKEEEHVFSVDEVNTKLSTSTCLREAFERVQVAQDQLHAALELPSNKTPTKFISKRGRLFVTRKGAQDQLVREVNVALFTFRKELMKQSHGSRLSDAVKIFLKELSKVHDIDALDVTADEETGAVKIMNGDEELDLKKMDKLSKPVAQLRDAIADLLENLETAGQSVPELASQSSDLATEAQELPSKIPDAVMSSGLSITDTPKAASATASNISALSNGPKIAKATAQMIAYAGREVTEAVRMPRGA